MQSNGSNAFLVIGEDGLCLASSQVPQSDSRVMASSHHLYTHMQSKQRLQCCNEHSYMYM